ncbi:MAG: D-cysteine desulfhydrase family protein [Thermoproteota archaeon]
MIGRILYKPRVRLTSLPTPLERAEKLGGEAGVELFVKRDDVMELAFGGNKVRKLEFILGDALSKGADTVITKGAYHSNHARLTAAAAAKLGLDAYLVLYPPGRPEPQGNLLLDALFGARIAEAPSPEVADEVMERLAADLRARGRKPYVIPGGGASPIGVYGYALALLEIVEQLRQLGKKPRYIVHATGTGATQAGLVLGRKLLGLEDVEIIGISVGRSAAEVRERVARLATESAATLGLDVKVDPEEVTVYERYTFGGYAVITREVVDTIKMVARLEGLVLDPVYTAKAMYGLLDLARRGEIERGSVVVFIHTGGTPIPFQYSAEIIQHLD